jgi:hypothetical protein
MHSYSFLYLALASNGNLVVSITGENRRFILKDKGLPGAFVEVVDILPRFSVPRVINITTPPPPPLGYHHHVNRLFIAPCAPRRRGRGGGVCRVRTERGCVSIESKK